MFAKGFTKISKDKKKKDKPKFEPVMTSDEMAKYVKRKADHICETGFAEGKPKEFEWKFIPKFPLDFAKKIKSDWPAWFKQESEEWIYNHGKKERAGHFDKWSESPALKPIVLVVGTEGNFHIWDGHHRIGKAVTIGMKDIPVILGVKKNADK
jgi:hypothetical protein